MTKPLDRPRLKPGPKPKTTEHRLQPIRLTPEDLANIAAIERHRPNATRADIQREALRMLAASLK